MIGSCTLDLHARNDATRTRTPRPLQGVDQGDVRGGGGAEETGAKLRAHGSSGVGAEAGSGAGMAARAASSASPRLVQPKAALPSPLPCAPPTQPR